MEPEMIQLTHVDAIYDTLINFDTDFIPSLSERGLDLKEYAQKLFNYALVFTIESEKQVIGFIAFYANDIDQKTAYLAQIALKAEGCHKGLGDALLKLAMETSKERGMKMMKLEVYHQNLTAISFYKRQGFIFSSEPKGEFFDMLIEL